MVEKEKWILYKHTCNYELVKAVALDVKNKCAANVSEKSRKDMQKRLAALKLYKTRNPKSKPLDSINHRINTLEYYLFGYEDSKKRFMFSPLGNLFIEHINDEKKLPKILATMLFGVQFPHYANRTPASFQLFPFRLLFKLMRDERLEKRLYNTEYAYLVAFVKDMDEKKYNSLVDKILAFRKKSDKDKFALLKKDEHTFVNCIYEWQYTIRLLEQAGVLSVEKGTEIGKLYHPKKTGSKSKPTSRSVRTGYVEVADGVVDYVDRMLTEYSCYEKPLRFDDKSKLKMDVVREISSFYPAMLLKEIGEEDEIQAKLIELPKLIEEYSCNPDNKTAYLFEDVLTEGFDMFINVETNKIGGGGHTDIECLYLQEIKKMQKKKKFAVEAKSTANKLSLINSGRLREHREEIGGEYTIVITSNYVPAVRRDIKGQPIVVILARTFSEYLYNHMCHDIREIDFKDFDSIIVKHLGEDISDYISEMTMEKFAAKA